MRTLAILHLAAALSFLTTGAATAQADSLDRQLRGCASIEKDSERLACYDTLSQSLKRAREQRAESDFGQEQKRIAEEAPKSIEATIAAIDEAAYGKLVITLDNGQVWRQKNSERVHWKSGDAVVVERALFGSFLMKPAAGGRSLRVKRVK